LLSLSRISATLKSQLAVFAAKKSDQIGQSSADAVA
jgi:hypothetical protein